MAKTQIHKIQSLHILFDHQIRTVYYASIPKGVTTLEDVRGVHPWFFAHPDCEEEVKASFHRCLTEKEPNFHVCRLNEKSRSFPNQKGCCWLYPVEPVDPTCVKQCVSIMCHCVLVPAEMDSLSQRERQVLACLGKGFSPNDIAQHLDIRSSTVNTHIWRAREKLKLTDILQVAVWATTYRDILDLDPKVLAMTD